MATFDPAAATAAFMASISPAADARAIAYTHGGEWLLLWDAVVTVAASILILKLGVCARIARAIERKRPRPFLATFVVAIVFLTMDWLLELPWASYASWWRERQYGFTNRPWSGWFADHAIVFANSLPVIAILIALVYALIRRARRTWPLWAGLVAGAFVLLSAWASPAVLEPLLNRYTPAPPGRVRDLVVTLGQRVGVPTDRIYVYNGSKQSSRYTANVAGLFGTARVAMSDTLFEQGADLSEVRGVVGHEMGHYVLRHVLWSAPFQAVMAALGGFGVMLAFPLARRWLAAKDIAGIGDSAGLPLLYAILTVLSLIATPVFNSWTRMQESAADAFSLQNAHEPDGLAAALVKTIAYRASSPSDLEEALFYNHPSVEHRVRAAMDWKAAHPNETPVG